MTFKDLRISYKEAHHKWGHLGLEKLQGLAGIKGYKLIGDKEECDACKMIKVKAKSVPRSTSEDNKAKHIGEPIYVYITGPFPVGERNTIETLDRNIIGMVYATSTLIKCYQNIGIIRVTWLIL